MLNVEEMIQLKNTYGFTYQKIANLSGVPLGTVQKVLGKITSCPRYDTLDAISKVLEPYVTDKVKEEAIDYYQPSSGLFAYLPSKEQGEFTVEDMKTLPEIAGIELIDGIIYVNGMRYTGESMEDIRMFSPSIKHQEISGELSFQLRFYIKSNEGDCKVFEAPLDVQSAKAEDFTKNLIQPDVLIVCDKNKLANGKYIVGAPDFVVEILSQSNRMDYIKSKVRRYRLDGVREYWELDPEDRIVTKVLFEEGRFETYSFDDAIPVHIFNGECVINLGEF